MAVYIHKHTNGWNLYVVRKYYYTGFAFAAPFSSTMECCTTIMQFRFRRFQGFQSKENRNNSPHKPAFRNNSHGISFCCFLAAYISQKVKVMKRLSKGICHVSSLRTTSVLYIQLSCPPCKIINLVLFVVGSTFTNLTSPYICIVHHRSYSWRTFFMKKKLKTSQQTLAARKYLDYKAVPRFFFHGHNEFPHDCGRVHGSTYN